MLKYTVNVEIEKEIGKAYIYVLKTESMTLHIFFKKGSIPPHICSQLTYMNSGGINLLKHPLGSLLPSRVPYSQHEKRLDHKYNASHCVVQTTEIAVSDNRIGSSSDYLTTSQKDNSQLPLGNGPQPLLPPPFFVLRRPVLHPRDAGFRHRLDRGHQKACAYKNRA